MGNPSNEANREKRDSQQLEQTRETDSKEFKLLKIPGIEGLCSTDREGQEISADLNNARLPDVSSINKQPIISLISKIRGSLSSFLQENLQEPAQIGFGAKPMKIVSTAELVGELEVGLIHLGLISENLNTAKENALEKQALQECFEKIQRFLLELRVNDLNGDLAESQHEDFLTGLISFRASLTETLENYALRAAASKLEQTPALAADQNSLSTAVNIQLLTTEVQRKVAGLLNEIFTRRNYPLGFSSEERKSNPLQTNELNLKLHAISQGLDNLYDSNLANKSVLGIHCRATTQNIQTSVDHFRVHLVRSYFTSGVPENCIPNFAQDLFQLQESLSEQLSQLEEVLEGFQTGPKKAA